MSHNSQVFKTCRPRLREVVVVLGKQRGCCWSVLEGWSWAESQTQLLWPLYPCHSTRGCGGGLDELARQSMKQGERVCVMGGGWKRRWMRMTRSRWRAYTILIFFLRDYLPVTQVELSRCIVRRLYEYTPSFLRLLID